MPDSSEEEIEKIEKAINNIKPISELLEQGFSLKEIAKKATGDENVEVIEEDIQPLYECDCSKEKMEKALISLGKEELEKIIKEDGKIEVVCNFCNKKYIYNK